MSNLRRSWRILRKSQIIHAGLGGGIAEGKGRKRRIDGWPLPSFPVMRLVGVMWTGGFEGKTLLHTGKYIKYPQNSKCQRWFKRVSSKKVRACPNLPPKEERPPQGFRLLVGTVLRETVVSRKNVMRRIFIISFSRF